MCVCVFVCVCERERHVVVRGREKARERHVVRIVCADILENQQPRACTVWNHHDEDFSELP